MQSIFIYVNTCPEEVLKFVRLLNTDIEESLVIRSITVIFIIGLGPFFFVPPILLPFQMAGVISV